MRNILMCPVYSTAISVKSLSKTLTVKIQTKLKGLDPRQKSNIRPTKNNTITIITVNNCQYYVLRIWQTSSEQAIFADRFL